MTNSPEKSPIIVAQDLACGYDGVPIMEHLNFSIDPGEIFFVIGGSGCGKSTLLRLLLRYYEVPAGALALGLARVDTLADVG